MNSCGFILLSSSKNTLATNAVNHNTYESFLLNSASKSNRLTGNPADSNKQYGYYDGSTGSGTKGRASFYTGSKCSGNRLGGSNPKGLGTPQE